MLIHSSLFRRCYPFTQSTDILLLEEKDREKLSKYIRQFPARARNWNMTLVIETSKGRYPHKPYFFGDLNALKRDCEELSNKVKNRRGLTNQEIKLVNRILYANKYNCLLSPFVGLSFEKEV